VFCYEQYSLSADDVILIIIIIIRNSYSAIMPLGGYRGAIVTYSVQNMSGTAGTWADAGVASWLRYLNVTRNDNYTVLIM